MKENKDLGTLLKTNPGRGETEEKAHNTAKTKTISSLLTDRSWVPGYVIVVRIAPPLTVAAAGQLGNQLSTQGTQLLSLLYFHIETFAFRFCVIGSVGQEAGCQAWHFGIRLNLFPEAFLNALQTKLPLAMPVHNENSD